MAEMGGDVEEGERLLGKAAERMRRPSARSFLDFQDEDGSDSDGSGIGGFTLSTQPNEPYQTFLTSDSFSHSHSFVSSRSGALTGAILGIYGEHLW